MFQTASIAIARSTKFSFAYLFNVFNWPVGTDALHAALMDLVLGNAQAHHGHYDDCHEQDHEPFNIIVHYFPLAASS